MSLIYTFMYMIIFLRIIIVLSFGSHQIRILSAVWEWRGNGTDCPVLVIYSFCDNPVSKLVGEPASQDDQLNLYSKT